MELRHLRYFVTVAKELSFTRAAQRLHISQPPLSQQIQDLESELGFSLFDRSNRSISLTQVGKEFLPEAQEILDNVSSLQQRAALRARGELGQLTIGLSSSLATPKFAAMLRAFQKNNPRIRISLVDRPSAWQLEALQQGKIDVGFLIAPSRIPLGLEVHGIKKEPMKLVVPSDHLFSKKTCVSWKELSNESFILVEPEIVSPDYYSEFHRRCRTAGFEPRVSQYTTTITNQIWLVSAGLGVAPVFISPDLDRWPGVSLVALPKDAPVYETSLVWRRSDNSPALRKFIGFSRKG